MNRGRVLPLAAFASIGLALGLGAFTLFHAKGLSYLADDPEACINCHVMNDQYRSWQHSSHRNWATCNECHMPHGALHKYYRKALNGWNHSVAFTTGNFPEPIVIRRRNKEVALQNCANCHGTLVNDMLVGHDLRRDELRCTECHGNVGHFTGG